MKKFYYKKNIPQEEKPILKALERSHTLLNALASDANTSEWHELGLRKKRSADITERESRRDALSSVGSDEWSSSSSMVITDSDLASSWIYSRKKAAANSAFESVSSDPISSPTDRNNLEESQLKNSDSPTIEFKRIPIAPTESSKSTCCCYMTVLLIICICSFGILTSIGGVIYLEIFAAPRTSTAAPDSIVKDSGMATLSMDMNVNDNFYSTVDNSLNEDSKDDTSTVDADQEKFKNSKTFQSRKGKFLDVEQIPNADGITEIPLNFTSSMNTEAKSLITSSVYDTNTEKKLEPSNKETIESELLHTSTHMSEKLSSQNMEDLEPENDMQRSSMSPSTMHDSQEDNQWLQDNIHNFGTEKSSTTLEKHLSPTLEEHLPPTTEKHLPPTTEKHLPPTTDEHLPPTTDEHLPPTMDGYLPPTMEEHLPPTIDRHLPSTMEDHLPPTIEDHLPPTMEDHLPSTMEEHLPSTMNEHLPPTMEMNAETELGFESELNLDDATQTASAEDLSTHANYQMYSTDAATVASTDAVTVKSTLNSLQESFAAVLKKLQRLDYNSLPSSRVKDTSFTRQPILNTESSTVETNSEMEKKRYLEKIRVLMYSSG